MSTQPIQDALQALAIFQQLDDSERTYLAQHATQHTFAANEVIIKEGDQVQAMYLIRQGVVRVSTSAMKREVELKKLGTGSYFGEVSVLSGKTATATVTAYENEVVTIAVAREALNELIQNNAEFRKTLEGVTLARAKDTISKVLK